MRRVTVVPRGPLWAYADACRRPGGEDSGCPHRNLSWHDPFFVLVSRQAACGSIRFSFQHCSVTPGGLWQYHIFFSALFSHARWPVAVSHFLFSLVQSRPVASDSIVALAHSRALLQQCRQIIITACLNIGIIVILTQYTKTS